MARWCSGAMVRTADSQSKCFESSRWAVSFTPRCSSLRSCIYEYLAIDSGGYVNG